MVNSTDQINAYDDQNYVEGVRDLANMSHVDKRLADVLRDCADLIEKRSQYTVISIPAKWGGGTDWLPLGASVEILAIDATCLKDSDDPELKLPHSHIACWIRCYLSPNGRPRYRSCDLGDLELANENYDKLIAGV